MTIGERVCLLRYAQPGGPGMTIGERVCLLRYAIGWGPSTLARASGVSRSALHELEKGRDHRPHVATVFRLAAALAVPQARLMGHGEDAAEFDGELERRAFVRAVNAHREPGGGDGLGLSVRLPSAPGPSISQTVDG